MNSDYYDSIAEGYNELHKEEQLKKLKIIIDNLDIKKNYKLLDIGCGTGFCFEHFNCKMYGIDPSLKLLKKVPERLFGTVITKQAGAEKIPFQDRFFDIIISVTAIQNFEDIGKAISEIIRIAKPNCQIIISCLKKSSKLDEIKTKLYENFSIKKEIEEEKDLIFVMTLKIN